MLYQDFGVFRENAATDVEQMKLTLCAIAVAKEIDELEEAMMTIAEEAEDGIDTVGVGDLLDDFVVCAAQVCKIIYTGIWCYI